MSASELSFLARTLLRLRNGIDYPLRQAVRLKRPGLKLRTDPQADPFAGYPLERKAEAQALAARLVEQYHLQAFQADSSPTNFRENLFYLHLLETALQASRIRLPESLQAADIGVSHWFYVQALAAGLRWWQGSASAGRSVHLRGYEMDAYRVYIDLHSRYDHAQAHMRTLPNVDYHPTGFAAQPAAYDLITLFFPFVFEKDHLEWGLPGSAFSPADLIAAAWESLKSGGLLLIVNQGQAEHAAEGHLLQRLGIPVQCGYRQDDLLFQYAYDRYLWLAIHP